MAIPVEHSPNMLIDRVDEHDRPVDQIPRSSAFDQRASFRVAHVLIFNGAGQLLLQQLAAGRDRHPLLWGSSVASYVPAGDSYAAAAKERMATELGIQTASLSELGKTVMVDNGCRKFIGVFKAMHEGPFSIDTTHIATVRFVPIHELLDTASRGELTPTLAHILRQIIANTLM